MFNKLFLPILLAGAPLAGAIAETKPSLTVTDDDIVVPVATTLKKIEPNFRLERVENKVYYYAPSLGKKEMEGVVKEVTYSPEGKEEVERDLIELPSGKIVSHGVSVAYYPSGALQRISFFDKGKLHGMVQTLYENGRVAQVCSYSQDVRHGKWVSYDEKGHLIKEGCYREGNPVGTFCSYYPSGQRHTEESYEDGVLHGQHSEWYEDGSLAAVLFFKKGVLHGTEAQPAKMLYYPDHAPKEVLNFQYGIPVGTHTQYYENGSISYQVTYKNGKKEGVEQFFSPEGALIGQGTYTKERPIEDHIRRDVKGVIIYEAHYDSRGSLLKPIVEYNEEGKPFQQYSLAKDSEGGYQDGVYDGTYREWYPSGQLKKEFKFSRGEFDGEQKEYYPNGALFCTSVYRNGIRQGLHQEWFQNGQLKLQVGFKDGLKEGMEFSWSKKGVQLLSCPWKHGKRDGIVQEWNVEGKLIAKKPFTKGECDGVQKEWWDNGQLKTAIEYKKGALSGPWKEWYANGSIKTERFFKDGHPVGEWTDYYEGKGPDAKGTLAAKRSYEDGLNEGEQIGYYPNGQISMILHFAKDKLSGKKQIWSQSGIKLLESNYAEDKLEGPYYERLDSGGEIYANYHNNLLQGLYQKFYPEDPALGKIKAWEGAYDQGLIDGEASQFNEAGFKIVSTFFKAGKKVGLASVYLADGRLLATTEYQDDRKQGLEIDYYPNGKVKRTVSWVNGEKDGEETAFHINGQKIISNFWKNGLLDGTSKEWSESGVLLYEAEYSEGQKNGKCCKYYENGQPRLVLSYEADHQVGVRKKFDPDGTCTEERVEVE